MTRRIRLGHNTSPKRTTALVACTAILLAAASGILWVAVKLLAEPFYGGPVDFWGEVVPAIGLSVLALCFTYFFGLLTYLSLTALRERRWLYGTMLGHRRLIRTVWVDLTTARVSLVRPHDWPREEDRLVAAAEDGTEVTLPLRGGGGVVPREHLAALANAVMARTGADDDAKATAHKLHRLADGPEALLSGRLLEAADAPPAPSAGTRTSARSTPILLLGLAVLLLMTSVSGGMWAWDEAEQWREFQQADDCRPSSGVAGCQTDRAATVVGITYCNNSRYCGVTRTTYVLRLSGGGQARATFRSRVSGPVKGDQVAVRLFHGVAVAIHDGSAWIDTNSNPRVALPYKFALACVFLGVGVGALFGAVNAGLIQHGGATHPLRRRRRHWGRIGWIWFWTPLPAFLAVAFFGSLHIWVLLLVDTATAIAVIAYFWRNGGLRRPAGVERPDRAGQPPSC